MQEFQHALDETAQAVEALLTELLPLSRDPESRLFEAIRYSALDGGKRMRPFLVTASAALFGVSRDCALRVAAAVECVHCYSLVHDDLPCMDDDDMRRGRLATHKAYDEATAVLAGDALLTQAFEILADPRTHEDARICCALVGDLARAAGAHGMVGGQMIDLEAARRTLDIGAITRMQQLKTGALIAFSCGAGAVLGRASKQQRQSLHAYAHDLGLAFQIADDLLDVEGTPEELGKRVGKDDAAGKATFVGVMGVARARSQAEMLSQQAIKHLDLFDDKADPLRLAAKFAVTRRG